MKAYYLDASALVKRYAFETGSAWIVNITQPTSNQVIVLSEITLAEVAAVLGAKQRAPHGITQQERDRALSQFLSECDRHYLLLKMDRVVIDLTVNLTQKYRLRGYDAVQLAAALVANQDLQANVHTALIFVAADNDLLHAAQAEGLVVENPLTH